MTTIDRPIPYTVTEAGAHAVDLPAIKAGFRLVPVQVGKPGEAVTVWAECPDWCVGHDGDRFGCAEDINHQGESAALTLTPSIGERVPFEVYLTQWPSSQRDARTNLAVDLDSDVALYDRTGALALADQMVAFAEDVRRKAMMLPDDAPATVVHDQADEALRRVRGGAA